MAGQREPILKAFVLCDEVRQQPNKDRMDVLGAGLSVIRSQSNPPFPCKQTFWAYLLLTDEKAQGRVKFSRHACRFWNPVYFPRDGYQLSGSLETFPIGDQNL
jgi:hypothetical protein